MKRFNPKLIIPMILLSFGIASCSYNGEVAKFEKDVTNTHTALYLNDAGTIQHQVVEEQWRKGNGYIKAVTLVTKDNEQKFSRVIQDQGDDQDFHGYHDEYWTNGAEGYRFYSPHLIQILDKTNIDAEPITIDPLSDTISADNKEIAEYTIKYQNDEGKNKFVDILDSLATVTVNEAKRLAKIATNPANGVVLTYDLAEKTLIGHKEFPTGNIASVHLKIYDKDDNKIIEPIRDEVSIAIKYRGADGKVCRTECVTFTQDGHAIVKTPNVSYEGTQYQSSFSEKIFDRMDLSALSDIYKAKSLESVKNTKDLVDVTK